MITNKRKWVKEAFYHYYENKMRLKNLKAEYAAMPIPGASGGNAGGGGHSFGNGVEKSVMHYLIDREKLERSIKECENKIALMDKTLRHFTVEQQAKGKRYAKYIQCRFLCEMSYRRSAVECGIAERTADFWLDEIFTVAEAIAEIEGYFS